MSQASVPSAVTDKRRTILMLSLAELFGMSVWFSASAVVPSLSSDWNLGASGQAWLTMSVQIGFVVGALGSSLLNLADYVRGHVLFSASCLLAALVTALIPLLATGLTLALPLWFLTGMFLAGVYPVGMKIIATWTKEDRGWGDRAACGSAHARIRGAAYHQRAWKHS